MDLQTLQTRQSKIVHDAEALLALADKETRALTTDEEKQYDTHVKALDDLGKQIARAKGDASVLEQIEALTGQPTDAGRMFVGRMMAGAKSIGQQFVEAEEFKAWVKDARNRGAHWTSPVIEVKATLTEDPASGGALAQPQYLPGIVPLPLPPPAVIDLLAPGTTNTNAVNYMREKVFTNAAAPTLEGGVKPESTLSFEAVSDPVRKVAHWLPASEEILEDVPTLRSYIDARLRLGVRVKFDSQLLSGDGVAPNILGILARPGLSAPIVRAASEPSADAILRQIAAIQTATNLMADGIVMHPTNWQEVLLMKTGTNEYIGDGPFMAIQTPTLWGLPVAITSAITLGTALVGSFRGAAQLFLRGPLAVAASNSHADFFIKNLVAIRAEQRGALCVFMPQAFGTVTTLGPVTP